jgi:hypothetical protein
MRKKRAVYLKKRLKILQSTGRRIKCLDLNITATSESHSSAFKSVVGDYSEMSKSRKAVLIFSLHLPRSLLSNIIYTEK